MIDYSSDFTYKVNKNNTVCITNYTGNSEKVEIPCEIDGMSVEEIGFMSFEQCTGIKEVTVPDTVAYIDDDAFAGCSQLTVINIPKNVNYIGSCVFDDCTNLKNITVDTDNCNSRATDEKERSSPSLSSIYIVSLFVIL